MMTFIATIETAMAVIIKVKKALMFILIWKKRNQVIIINTTAR